MTSVRVTTGCRILRSQFLRSIAFNCLVEFLFIFTCLSLFISFLLLPESSIKTFFIFFVDNLCLQPTSISSNTIPKLHIHHKEQKGFVVVERERKKERAERERERERNEGKETAGGGGKEAKKRKRHLEGCVIDVSTVPFFFHSFFFFIYLLFLFHRIFLFFLSIFILTNFFS